MLLDFRSSNFFIIATIAIAVFTDVFLYGLIVPVVPFALHDRLDIAQDHVQLWTAILLAVYGAAALVASPFAGWVADNTKTRRAPLLAGLIVLLGSTMMLMLSKVVWLFVLGRLLQGFSTAVVWCVGLALVVDTVPPERLAEATGWIGIAPSAGSFCGPLIGGAVYEKSGYYAVFAVALALVGLDIVLRILLIEKKTALRYKDDQEARPRAVRSPDLLRTTKKSKLPPILRLLALPRMLNVFWIVFMQAWFLTAADAVLPLRVNALYGFDSLAAGLLFLCLVIPSLVSPFIGRWCDLRGPREPATLGFILSCPFWILLRLPEAGGTNQIVFFCSVLVLIGISLSFVLPPAVAETAWLVDAEERSRPGFFGNKSPYAQSYAIINIAFSAGTTAGPLVSAALVNGPGWAAMTWVLGLLGGLTAIPAFILTGGILSRQEIRRVFVWHGKEQRQSTDVELEPSNADADVEAER